VPGSDAKTTRRFMQSPQTVRRTFFLATVGIVAVGVVNALRAQTPPADSKPPRFEVASVKPNTSLTDPSHSGGGFQPGGRFSAKNLTVRLLIQMAYGDPRPLSRSQIAGGPAWLNSDGFDIEAKVSTDLPETQVVDGSGTGKSMLQVLLKDRFKLSIHHEMQQRQVYSLVTVKTDGRMGPRLRPSSGADCDNARASEPSGRIAAGSLPRCGSYVLEFANGHFTIQARFITMEAVAMNMRNLVDRVVLAPSAPTGTYSLDLDFNPGAPAAPPAGVTAADAPPDDAVSIFTALQEQLGLKLEPTTGPVDIVVIDHVEHPTPD
jgi:uncharacterized protein (TIGR03435 family)